MLASCGAFAIVEALQAHHLPIQHILILLVLGIMGLRLPKGKVAKAVYTAIEIGLIFYGTLLGYLHILPTLYLIVMIRSCFMFESFGRWMIAGLSFLLFLINQIQYFHSIRFLVQPEDQHRFWMHQLSEILMFTLGLFFVIQLINTLLTERQTQRQLSMAHHQLQQYALEIESLAAVQERNRIAREIHDSLGHVLTALNVQLQTAAKLWAVDPTEAQTFLVQAKRLGETAMKEVRHSVHALRADAVEVPDLWQSIETLVEDFQQGTGIIVSTQIDRDQMLPAQTRQALYRIVQEALTNICKYAQATAVQIQLTTQPEQVCLVIADNGQGFSKGARSTGFGLQGMRERVAALHGEFYLETAPGSGCQITVKIPTTEGKKLLLVQSEP